MADSTGRNIVVPGRIVWTSGDLFQGKIQNVFGTQTPVLDNEGKPVKQYGFGLAVEKAKLNMPGNIWLAIHEEAYQVYPSRQLPPGFAMKVKDGDGVDHNGQPMANREGHKGCMIFSLTTRIQMKFFRFDPATNNNVMINDGVKCGDYVEVQVNVKAHGPVGQGKPGMYLNPIAVRLTAYGEAIINMPSGDDIFGTQAPAIPPGGSATPLAPPAAFPMQGVQQPQAMPGFGAPQMASQAAPQAPAPGVPGFGQQPAQAPMPQPHYGVLPQAHQPPQMPPGVVQAPQGMPMPPSFGAPPPPMAAPQQQWAPQQMVQSPTYPPGTFGNFPPPPGV